MKNSKPVPTIPENPRRAIAKNKRGKGKLAMGQVSEKEWCQASDPLFKVKGKERHARLKQIR